MLQCKNDEYQVHMSFKINDRRKKPVQF